MSTLNYIDENGNINKVGVIPQNVIDKNIIVESAFTLPSGISLWTINKLIIKPNACGDGLGYAHFNISVYGSMKSGDVIATLPSGYAVRSGGCRFGGTLLKSGVVKPTELVFTSNSADVKFSGSDFDTASTQYISFNGTIPIKRV